MQKLFPTRQMSVLHLNTPKRSFLFCVLLFFGLLFFGLLSTFLSVNVLYAQDTVKLYNNGKTYEIGKQTTFFEDESHKLVFEEIEKKPFQKLNKRIFQHRLTSSPIWFRMVVHNPSHDQRTWFLGFQKTEIYDVHLYYRDNEGKKHDFVSGLHYYPNEKAHTSSGVCFPLILPPKTTYTIYVRTVNYSFLSYVPTLTPEKIYEKDLYFFYLAMGLYYGLVLVILIYNIFNFYHTKKIFYLYLIGAVLSFMVLSSSYDGVIYGVMPSLPILLGGFQNLVFAGIFLVTFSKFLHGYFLFEKNALYYYLYALFFIGSFLVVLGIFRLKIGFELYFYLLPYLAWVFFQIFLFIWRNPNYSEKYFFTIGLGIFFFALLVAILANEHVIPVTYFTRLSLHWGFSSFALSVSFGLQFQMHEKGIKLREQELITQELIKNKNLELQQQVTSRTQELAQKELNIRGVIESTHDLIYALDKDFNILVFNSASEKNAKTIYNVKLEIGKNYLEIMPQEVKKLMEIPLKQVLTERKPIFIQQHASIQQRKIYRDIFLNPIYDDNNQVVGLSIFSKDVTQSSLTRKDLLYNQTFLQTVFDNSPDALFLVNENNYLIEKCNKTAVKMFDAISEHDFLGKKGSIFHQNNITEDERIFIRKSISQTGQWEGEYMYHTRRGKPFWGNVILTTFELQNKTYQLARITDITSKKQIEQDLKEINNVILSKQGNLTALLENNDFAIWLVDGKGELVDGNNFYKKIYFDCYGYESPKNESLAFRFSRAEKITWTHRFRDILAGEEGNYLEKRVIKGKTHHFNIRAFPVKHGQNITGASFFAQDITQSINADRKLKRKNKVLKKLNSELDKFVYRASHDLRAPLSSILGLIGLANLQENDKETVHYLELMKKSVYKLDNFIQQIVHYSRNVRVSIKPEVIDLAEMLEKIFENLQFMPKATRVQKEIDIQTTGKNIVTDSFRLEVILNNLISNAFRYANTSQEISFVKIQIFWKNNFFVINISDNGQGIDEVHLPKIFDMFYKATDQNTGSGLGLYIVKEAVQVLKGSITVQSTLKKGTTFTLKIPNLAQEKIA